MIYRSFVKPLLDILVGIVGTLLTLPIILVLCILIRLESSGSPIFSQKRVGRGLKEFKIFKLRSMVKNAALIGPGSTKSGDSRITKLGAFLRKTSLDELPQFWNLALGQMSLIGPRPGLGSEIVQYKSEDLYRKRHRVLPGITGLAQARYRSTATPEQRLSSDLEYVENCSLSLDLKILALTFSILFDRNKGN